METGIFAKTFARPSLGEVLDGVRAAGLSCVQFNFSCAGLPTLPGLLPADRLDEINQAHQTRGLRMAAISGTTNLIDPNAEKRREGWERVADLVRVCRGLGTGVVTLCSGSCDPDNMWRGHPDNSGAGAWRGLVQALEFLLPHAEAAGVVLAVEPEQANVVNSARRARQLVEEMRSSALQVLFDPANLLTPASMRDQHAVLEQAIREVEGVVVLAHAKDVDARGAVCGLGAGVLDWKFYVELLKRAGFDGPVILHGMNEAAVADSVEFWRRAVQQNEKQ